MDSRNSSSLILRSATLGPSSGVFKLAICALRQFSKALRGCGVVTVAINDQGFCGTHECPMLKNKLKELGSGWWPDQKEAGTMASPRMSKRAVRSKAACVTFCAPGKWGAGSVCKATLNSPVGCSTDTFLAGPEGMTATPSQTEPSNTQAVPTVTAAKTPMASWQTWGMKLLVCKSSTILGRRNERHLGIIFLAHIAQAHQPRNLQSKCLDLGLELQHRHSCQPPTHSRCGLRLWH
jgi:hypothetical protein